MFALVLIALVVLLAVASLTILADSGLRWWSALAALRLELAHCDLTDPRAPIGGRRRAPDHSRAFGVRVLNRRAALRAAA